MGVYFTANWAFEGDPTFDVKAANEALGTHYQEIDLAAYRTLEALHDMPEGDDEDSDSRGYERWKALTSHPLYKFFGMSIKSSHLSFFDYEEHSYAGEIGDRKAIREYIEVAGWNINVLKHISHLSYG